MFKQQRVTAILPALNEAASIRLVLSELAMLKEANGEPIVDEVIVADNGSDDDTASIAESMGATIVVEPERGYGAACQAALREYSRTAGSDDDIVVFVDADHSVNSSELPDLLQPISEGADLVIGNRNGGHQDAGAMSPQQIFGNKLATALIRKLWRVPISDLGPFRAIRRDALLRIDMQDRAFGWTCEMQVRAIQESLLVVEVPVTTLRRIGKSKISGTLLGSLRAGHGIFSTVLRLWAQQRRQTARHAVPSREPM